MMSYSARVISGVGGNRVVSSLGILYVGLAVGWVFSEVSGGALLGNVLFNAILIGSSGLVLVYWGRRLHGSNIDSELYATVARWCLGAIAAMLGVLLLYHIQPADSLTDPVESVLILTALASVAGLGIGIHDARARTRAREAERHSREVERQNDRLESFAGMLAHELRNPLNIAQIYHPQEQPRNENAAQQVESALGRIEEMIDVLLVTARSPNASVDAEPVALADVATEAWADASTQSAGSPAQTADLDVATDRTIEADPVHVEHLLRNLFRNSFEHGDDEVTVRVGDLPSGFYVADDGPGIPEDAREDVVEAGFTTKTDGIGLGLTFVAQLAEMYDWEYSIDESEIGGARFEFTNVERVSAQDELQRH
jgi:signal transduction histidine kinase